MNRTRAVVLNLITVALIAAAFVCALFILSGCGPAFVAAPDDAQSLSTAGAGGHSQTLPQAGAGGLEVSNGNAGQSDNTGGDSAAGGPSIRGGSGGAADGTGGRGMGAGGSGAQGGADSSAACLNNWEGSSCDTCTNSPSADPGDAGARTCMAVLDCFVLNHCTPATCAGLCEYNEPTTDAAVHEAEHVAACRCGGAQ